MKRQCGECQLCCRLLPVREIGKERTTRCEHQRHRKGCAIYNTRPNACRLWSCRWLTGDDTADMPRPDRCHYVIDIMPDFCRCEQDGKSLHIPIIQIWVDPRFPDAHRDPALRRYLERRAMDDGNPIGAIRIGNEVLTLVAPALTAEGKWLEIESTVSGEHTPEEIAQVLGPLKIIMEDD